MTPQERRARLREIQERMEHLRDYATLTQAQEREFDALMVEALGLERDDRLELIRSAAPGGSPASGGSALLLEHGDGGSAAQPRSTLTGVREQARRLVDAEHRAGRVPDHAAAKVERLVTAPSTQEATTAARWAIATGSEAYRGAFTKLLTDPEKGHLLWTQPEADAFREAELFRSETRAMSLSSGALH